jgi:hypothetical protein
MIQRQNISHGFIEVFCLIQQGLSVESGNIFVEIDSEEVQAAAASLERRRVVLDDIVEVLGRLGGNWPHLFIASGIAGYEEHRDAFDLKKCMSFGRQDVRDLTSEPYSCVLVKATFAVKIYGIFAGKASVLGIKFS